MDKILAAVKLKNVHWFWSHARAEKAKDLGLGYVRHEQDAVALVDEHLADAGTSLETLLAKALARKLDDIERIDRPNRCRRGPPQRRLARDRSASRGSRRNTATYRARARGEAA